MRLPVVLSILAHAGLVLLAFRLPATRLVRAPHVVSFEIKETKPAPKRAVPAPLPTPPVAPPTPSRRRQKEPLPPPRSPSAPATAPVPTRPTAPVSPPVTPPLTSSLNMRQRGPVDLNLHSLGGIVLTPAPSKPGSGTLASSAPKPWRPRGDAGDPLLGKLAEEKEERFPLDRKEDGWHYDGPSFSAVIAPDGTVDFNNHAVRDFKGLSGGFDVTDLIMKSRHQDPYRYEKERFMDETAKLRTQLKQAARRARLEASLETLPTTLERLWSDARRTPRQRRSLLYSMWRDAAGSQADVGSAGQKARALIEAFIRDRLPEGSEDAYTAEELRRYNAHASAVPFRPYVNN